MGDPSPVKQWTEPLESGPSTRPLAPFGPEFFLTHFGAFVRDQCPSPSEGLPVVQLQLSSGEMLELCHVIALSPQWVALAVFDGMPGESSRPMRTDILPYELLVRITIRRGGARGAQIGFHQESPPSVHGLPELALETAARRNPQTQAREEPPAP